MTKDELLEKVRSNLFDKDDARDDGILEDIIEDVQEAEFRKVSEGTIESQIDWLLERGKSPKQIWLKLEDYYDNGGKIPF